jgi:hypothetical protein
MPRPSDLYQSWNVRRLRPGVYAKRVLTHYAPLTPKDVRDAVADQITERYRQIVRPDLEKVSAWSVIALAIDAAGQRANEMPSSAFDRDADKAWEKRRNEILLAWGLSPMLLPPEAM